MHEGVTSTAMDGASYVHRSPGLGQCMLNCCVSSRAALVADSCRVLIVIVASERSVRRRCHENPHLLTCHGVRAVEDETLTVPARSNRFDPARRQRSPQAIAGDDEGRSENVDRLLERSSFPRGCINLRTVAPLQQPSSLVARKTGLRRQRFRHPDRRYKAQPEPSGPHETCNSHCGLLQRQDLRH
jgi:hypothetical protein